MLTIVIADDHQIVRQGIRYALESETGFHVLGESNNGVETCLLVENLKPNVLITDLFMPGMNGLEITMYLRQHTQQTHIVLFSMYANESYVKEAFLKGASAYVVKESSIDTLIFAVHEAAAGRIYINLSRSNPKDQDDSVAMDEDSHLDPYEKLTRKEQHILDLIIQGFDTHTIAKHLSIEPEHTTMYRSHIMRKLNLETPADLLVYAINRDILLSDKRPDMEK
jgi:two-component system, NarL family, response regulator NreC